MELSSTFKVYFQDKSCKNTSETAILPRDRIANSLVSKGEEFWYEKLLVEEAGLGDFESVADLLTEGVNVDAEEYNKTLFYASKNYLTPLQMACTNNHIKCAQLLIEHGADVNAKDRFDVTALHMAAENGNLACLKALLHANAECSPPTKFSKSGSYTAVPHPGGTTPIHLAAAKNHVECVKELIQYGADYNAVDERGRTSLYIAAMLLHNKCVLAHLENAVGRDILALPSFESGDTPLHFAVDSGMLDCIKELLKAGSDVNHRNHCGQSPLHLAASPTVENEKVCFQVLKLLVLKGYNTDINLMDTDYHTPLHYVCFNGGKCYRRPKWIKFLIAYGADVNIQHMRGFSLLEHELRTAEFDVLQYIVRSMLVLPPISKLKMHNHLPFIIMPRSNPRLPIPAHLETYYILNPNERNHPHLTSIVTRGPPPMLAAYKAVEEISYVSNKQGWYETMASNPRTLQHTCRYAIRKALGPLSMKHIKRLPLPSSLHSYLLLEHGD